MEVLQAVDTVAHQAVMVVHHRDKEAIQVNKAMVSSRVDMDSLLRAAMDDHPRVDHQAKVDIPLNKVGMVRRPRPGIRFDCTLPRGSLLRCERLPAVENHGSNTGVGVMVARQHTL
jgi:hypothetical protein